MPDTVPKAAAKTTHAVAACVAAIALNTAAPVALGQGAYPVRPVRFVVPYPPGGSTDPTAHLIGAHLTSLWGQQVVVDNRPGGSSIIGGANASHIRNGLPKHF